MSQPPAVFSEVPPVIRLLHLEDSARDSQLIEDRIEATGLDCEIVRANSRERFEAELKAAPFDLILCDYNLPGYGGVTAIRDARRLQPDTPVMIVSGSIGETEAVACLHAGATDYLLKQQMERFGPALRRALDEAASQRQRRKAEADLRASEAEFRLLTEAMPQIVWITRPDGYHVHFNRRWYEFTGLTPEQSLGGGWNPAFHPEDQERAARIWSEALATGEPYEIEYRLRRADGTYHWMLGRALPMRDARGEIVKWFGTCTDIDELKQAQTQIGEQAALLDLTQDAIVVRDLEHRVLYWNKGAERTYGWTAEEAVGRPVTELIYRTLDVLTGPMEILLQRGEWRGEVQHVTKGGVELIIEGRWTLLRTPEGAPKSVLAVNTNITERKALESQFLRAQRMESIGTLAGGIAHDLNNLLAPIVMGVELLKPVLRDQTTRAVIETMEQSARRGTDLVRQVLSFARGVEGARVSVHLGHAAREVEGIARNTFPRNIDFRLQVARDVWLVEGDPTQINQVLLNLCVNARDSMPEGGVLALTAKNIVIDEAYAAMNRVVPAGRYVVIEVFDAGTGIPSDVLDRIFEPFFTTKGPGKGSGLGLSTVLGIVRSHGGAVTVESELGKGSTFRVYLPARPDSGSAAGPDPEKAYPHGRGECVLVVDDDGAVLSIASQTLRSYGYEVLTAEDGAQAMAIFAMHRERIRVIVTDMMMPVMDGAALIAALRRVDPAIRIIATSGLHGNAGKAGNAGEKHFLTKPYTAGALLTLLAEVLTA